MAVHFTTDPLEEGAEVEMEVDWGRRFDHMQQHSGIYIFILILYNDSHSFFSQIHLFAAQHLITAIAYRDFGHKTTSWSVLYIYTALISSIPTLLCLHVSICICIRNLAIGSDSRCFVELAVQSLSVAELGAIEETCNEAIRGQVPMTPHWFQPGTPELEKVLTHLHGYRD